MPRRPRPWFRTSHKSWYAKVHGVMKNLGVHDPNDEAAAWAAMRRLLERVESADPGPRAGTVAELAAEFLAERRGRVRPATAAQYAHHLGHLSARLGGSAVASLGAGQVAAVADRPDWSATYRANVINTVEMFLRWCGRPLKLPKPPRQSRGADAVVPEPVYRLLLRETHGDFHQLIKFLWHTGCRPGEAAAATAADLDRDARQVRLRQHKTAHRVAKPRVIYLDDVGFEVACGQADRYREGLLFRGQAGRQLSMAALTTRFDRLSTKVGHKVTAYCFRHSWATRALAAGESDTIVAALMGHRSTQVLHANYAHLGQQSRVLAEAAARLGQKVG